jgi:hypothetical protein
MFNLSTNCLGIKYLGYRKGLTVASPSSESLGSCMTKRTGLLFRGESTTKESFFMENL